MAVVGMMEVITLDDGSDDESVSSTSSASNSLNAIKKMNNFGSSSGCATAGIMNVQPLDLSQFLPFSSVPPKPLSPSPPPSQTPPTQMAKKSLPLNINAPFMSRPTFIQKNNGNNIPPKIVGAVNGNTTTATKNGTSSKPSPAAQQPNNHLSSVLLDANRKRSSLEMRDKPSTTDKRPRLSAPPKKDIHGSLSYVASEPNHGFTAQDGEEFSGQFRCTSYNCNKVLPNNVSLMYHLWAHVGFFTRREYTMDFEQMSDEKFTRMCSVCLMICETPFERTRHYLEVHRGVFATYKLCHMCEIVDHDGKHNSHIKHRQNELPYECRRCKYRASSRMALIDHFAKIHVGTTMLMCPFCPYTTSISASEKQKTIVLAKNYVQHVTDHGNVISKKCSCCSYKFIDDERFEKHTKCHQAEQHKYPLTFKSFKALKDEALKTKPRHEMLTLLKCVECNTQFPKAEDHFDHSRKCNNCSFETTCLRSYWNHVHLSDCDPENKQRFEFAIEKSDKFEKPKCSWKYKKNIKIYKSPQFIQSFRLFRDFSFDRKPSNLPLPPPKTEEEIMKERRDKLRSVITVRKLNDIPSHVLDGICESIFGENPEDSSTIKLVQELRRPQTPFYQQFLDELKQKEEEGGEDSLSISTSTCQTASSPATPAA